ncbi:uncharacterized protein LOC135345695 isoform X2 [Halichondria panicea]
MASKGNGSHDCELRRDSEELHSDSEELHSDSEELRCDSASDKLLGQVCEQLSLKTTREMVATSLKPGTQNMVSSQLLPLHFDPHGLATPISVIVNLLVHCFLLNREIEEVKGHAAEVTEDVRVLKELYEGVVHVNQQWAVDYDKLLEQVASTKQSPSSRRHSDVLMSPSSEKCFECFMGRQNRVGGGVGGGECEALRNELQQVKARLEAIKRDRDRVSDENKAIQFQLQDLGDLQQAMLVREDYPKKLSELKAIKRQHQDEVCVRIKLEKQIERLRNVFTDLFPAPVESGRSHSSYPPSHLRPCHTQQAFYSDPGPPTPPGLIARGHPTSLVERDIHMLSQRYPKRHNDQLLVRNNGQLSRQQERWASDPHLNINGSSLVPPTPHTPLKPRCQGRPRSLCVEQGNMAPSLSDERCYVTTEESTNHITAPLADFEGGKCSVCGETFERSDLFFDHVRMCGT